MSKKAYFLNWTSLHHVNETGNQVVSTEYGDIKPDPVI